MGINLDERLLQHIFLVVGVGDVSGADTGKHACIGVVQTTHGRGIAPAKQLYYLLFDICLIQSHRIARRP